MSSKGLSVIGVTGAAKGPTEKWIKKFDAKYAYGYDTSRELSSFLGIRSIPAAVIVSPSGKIVWQGHPSGLNEKVIKPHLTGAISRPMWEWPKSASSVAKALKKRQFAKATKAAAVLAKKDQQFGTELIASVSSLVKGQVAAIQADFDAGRFLQVIEAGKTAKKSLSGLPEAKSVSEIIARTKSDKTAKRTIALQKRFRAMTAKPPRSRRDAQELIANLKKLQRAAEGTVAAKEAEAFIAGLEANLQRMR